MSYERSQNTEAGTAGAGSASEPELENQLRKAQADCAELLDANRRLRQAAHRKDDLLAICARDLRAPVDMLAAQTRLLLSGARGPLDEAQRKSLEAIERQGKRLLALSEDLAGLATLEAEPAAIERTATDMGTLCNEVADSLAPLVRERGGAIVRSIPPFPLSLPVDPAKLRRVLATLLSNALLASPRGGIIDLTLEPHSNGVRIRIEGSGPPEPAEDAPLLAQRLRASREPHPHAGTELGLAICRELVQLHGGELAVASTTAGGPVFTLALPATSAEPTPLPGALQPGGLRKARILVVDDEDDIRDALVQLLEGTYRIATAKDGREAVRLALEDPPELVLMDLVMPHMDGFGAIEALRADPVTSDIPVILISARGDDLTRVKGLDLGAVDFLRKPFSERELKARIERTLRMTQRQTQLRELAQTDTLTGLANLRAFRTRLEEEAKRARRYLTPLTCVMADMDNLKPLNDQLGHAAGDRAIAAVADVMRTDLRETDFCARYGGDEFVVLLPHTTAAEGRVFAERVRARLRLTAVEAAARKVPLSVSFGVSQLDPDAGEEAADALVLRADEALYAAKRAGRGLVAVYGEPVRDPTAPAGIG